MNIFDSLERRKNETPDKEAAIFEGRPILYRELYDRVCRLSSALQSTYDIRAGDRVALFLPNRPEFLVSYYAVVRLGAIAVSLNIMFKREEVKFILNDSVAKVLITTPQLLEQVPDASDTPALKNIVSTGKADAPRTTEIDRLIAPVTATVPRTSLDKDAGAAILYTSGTTGNPKGVLLSHENLISNIRATQHHTKMTSNDRLICYLPLFHCFGQNFIMNACFDAGATMVLHERFQPDEILNSIKSNSVSMFLGVPTVYARLLTLPNIERAMNGIRYYFTAAATMPVPVASQWHERVGSTIWEGDGMTKT
jgi:long-chain acyl-CoA synthetase